MTRPLPRGIFCPSQPYLSEPMSRNVRSESTSTPGISRSLAIYCVVALAILFVVFAVRVYRLDAIGLEGDEAFSAKAAYPGLSDIVHLVSTTDPHYPPASGPVRPVQQEHYPKRRHLTGLAESTIR